jgi:hypothetical protein
VASNLDKKDNKHYYQRKCEDFRDYSSGFVDASHFDSKSAPVRFAVDITILQHTITISADAVHLEPLVQHSVEFADETLYLIRATRQNWCRTINCGEILGR